VTVDSRQAAEDDTDVETVTSKRVRQFICTVKKENDTERNCSRCDFV